MMMANYSLARLLEWNGREFDPGEEADWLDLLDDFGPAMLRFLLRDGSFQSIPESDASLKHLKFSLRKNAISTLKPERGAVWVLFALEERLKQLPFPLRNDGILLPFEWRRDPEKREHSALLPAALTELADRVKLQFGEAAADCRLQPAHYFHDQVDFQIAGATFDSACGALASGLYLLLHPGARLLEWPFSSIGFDFERREMAPVSSLPAKFRLAAEFQAEEFAVAPKQYKEAIGVLARMRQDSPPDSPLRKLRIYLFRETRDLCRDAGRIVRCNQHNRRRGMLRRVVFLLSLLLTGVAVGGIYYHDMYRVHCRYYAEYVERRGVPEGLFELTPEQAAKRSYHYRFEFLGRKGGYRLWRPGRRGFFGERLLRTVRCVNSAGRLRDDVSRYPNRLKVAEQRLYYNEDGSLNRREHFNADGKMLHFFRYSGADAEVVDIMEVKPAGEIVSAAFPLLIRSEQGGDEIRRLKYTRDAKGYIEILSCKKDASDRPATDGDGVSQYVYRRDAFGRVVERRCLDEISRPSSDKYGVSCIRYFYDGADLIRMEYYDRNGDPCDYDNLGEVRWFGYSPEGNCIREEYLRYGMLFKLIVREYDSRGNGSRESRLDGEGHSLRGISPAHVVRRWNEYGDCVESLFFDADGRPQKWYFSGIKEDYRYRNGKIVFRERSYWKANQQPGHDGDNIFKRSFVFDERGNLLEEARYDSAGKLRAPGSGIALIRREYDSQNRLLYEAFFGADGKPVAGSSGWAARKREYIDRWNLLRQSYFDVDNRPFSLDGFCVEETYEQPGGNYMVRRGFGPDNQPVLNRFGWAAFKVRFDENCGKLKLATSCDTTGKKVAVRCGKNFFAEIQIDYNQYGQETEIRYYDEKGNLLMQPDNYAVIQRFYIPGGGKCREMRTLDSRWELCLPRGGMSARTEYFYDPSGRLRMEKCYTPEGSFVKRTLNERAEFCLESNHNPDGTPRLDDSGVHSRRYSYNADGNLEYETFLGVDGKICRDRNQVAMIRHCYDSRKKEIRREFLDENRRPCLDKNGVAGWEVKYDSGGRKQEEIYFGVDGRVKKNRNGVARIRFFHNGEGRVAKRLFLNEAGRPARNLEGIAGWESEYDSSGNEIRRCLFDLDGSPARVGGCASWRKTYNARGQVTKEVHYDEKGNVAPQLIRWENVTIPIVETVFSYDSAGRRVDATGRLWRAKPAGGAVCIHVVFNRNGEPEQLRFLDGSGKPAAGPMGWSVLRATYDSAGLPVRVACYNERNELVLGSDGVAVRERRYNEKNQLTEELYYDENALPVSGPPLGVARMKAGYDSRGRISSIAFFDQRARPCTPEKFRHLPRLAEVVRLEIRYEKDGSATLICFDRRGRQVGTSSIPRDSSLSTLL